jgi:hypothetical protein
MSFTNLLIYDALLKSYACQSLADGVVCSVQGKGSRGLQFMRRRQDQVDGYTHNSYKKFNTREEAEEGYLQFLMEVPQEVDHDQEDALVPIKQEGALVPVQQEDARCIGSSRMKDMIILIQSFVLLVIAYYLLS